jgi:hypothetical protein
LLPRNRQRRPIVRDTGDGRSRVSSRPVRSSPPCRCRAGWESCHRRPRSSRRLPPTTPSRNCPLPTGCRHRLLRRSDRRPRGHGTGAWAWALAGSSDLPAPSSHPRESRHRRASRSAEHLGSACSPTSLYLAIRSTRSTVSPRSFGRPGPRRSLPSYSLATSSRCWRRIVSGEAIVATADSPFRPSRKAGYFASISLAARRIAQRPWGELESALWLTYPA